MGACVEGMWAAVGVECLRAGAGGVCLRERTGSLGNSPAHRDADRRGVRRTSGDPTCARTPRVVAPGRASGGVCGVHADVRPKPPRVGEDEGCVIPRRWVRMGKYGDTGSVRRPAPSAQQHMAVPARRVLPPRYTPALAHGTGGGVGPVQGASLPQLATSN